MYRTRSWHDAAVQIASDPSTAISYWLRDPAADVGDPPLEPGERLEVDVAIVGGGFTGLWTAIHLTDTDPSLRVAVLEAETVAFGATGRNGGFCEASLTHGLANGIRHFPDELERLEGEGIENLQGLIAFTRAHGIDCDLHVAIRAVLETDGARQSGRQLAMHLTLRRSRTDRSP